MKFKPTLPTIYEEPAEAAKEPQKEEIYPGGPPSELLKRAMARPPYPGGPPSKLLLKLRDEVNILVHSQKSFIIPLITFLC